VNEVQVFALRAGYCVHPQVMAIRDGRWRPARFPALAMLIVHPSEGPILFDTGYDPAFLAATRRLPERLYRWATPVTLADPPVARQIAAWGFAPSDVKHVVLSHFHGDHVAGLHAFTAARIHCARAGAEPLFAASRWQATRRGLLPSLLPADFAQRASYFEDRPRASLPLAYAPLAEGRDLLGDGSLLAVALPGHCPGHFGLALRDAAHGPHLLVGDAAWSLDAIRRDMPPPALSMALLGDARETRGTLHLLHQVWQRNPGLRMTPCHCPERALETVQRP
jgi:glyoxylase-like metal-dependent hydrolase (beta-lactamase superfamily II)